MPKKAFLQTSNKEQGSTVRHTSLKATKPTANASVMKNCTCKRQIGLTTITNSLNDHPVFLVSICFTRHLQTADSGYHINSGCPVILYIQARMQSLTINCACVLHLATARVKQRLLNVNS